MQDDINIQDDIKQTDVAYLAGLFDGEGSVMYKQYIEKRKNRPNPMKCWRIRLDVAMTDKHTIEHMYKKIECRLVGTQNGQTRT